MFTVYTLVTRLRQQSYIIIIYRANIINLQKTETTILLIKTYCVNLKQYITKLIYSTCLM